MENETAESSDQISVSDVQVVILEGAWVICFEYHQVHKGTDPIGNTASLLLFTDRCLITRDVFDYAGACLFSHYVETAMSSGSAILALSESVTI
jgi:hypothetical protein